MNDSRRDRMLHPSTDIVMREESGDTIDYDATKTTVVEGRKEGKCWRSKTASFEGASLNVTHDDVADPHRVSAEVYVHTIGHTQEEIDQREKLRLRAYTARRDHDSYGDGVYAVIGATRNAYGSQEEMDAGIYRSVGIGAIRFVAPEELVELRDTLTKAIRKARRLGHIK